MKSPLLIGAEICFRGIVQGVGFRPLVYRRAHSFNLMGTIRNTDSGVIIRVEGSRENVEAFYRDLLENPPVLAEIHKSSIDFYPPEGLSEFTILESSEGKEGSTPISPDIATCQSCLKEIFTPSDRRYRYPFTNCTDCGPRFTIIRSVPYDRHNTTMGVFKMCPQCQGEYSYPLDRRYHAQPNACPVCGPKLRLFLPDGMEVPGDPLKEAVKLLKEGKILAIKGLGGYHLAVMVDRPQPVRRLRERKKRPGKPFALMARNIEIVKKYCLLDSDEEKLLHSYARPIVLLEKSPDAPSLPEEIAPDTSRLGIMLPYTPLHHILMEEGPELLIMTSANLSEEPLCYRDEEALETLKGIADAFLTHNREIARPCDDSVICVVNGKSLPIRRSRGYVPRAIDTGVHEYQLLAAGADEKNTFCIFKDGKAFPGHHIGDLNNEKSFDAYIKGISDFLDIFRVSPEAVACDSHPDYVSTRYARKLAEMWGIPLIMVQHHHAHIASVLGEHGIDEDVIGLAFDGTGWGEDGTVWGGEFLIANRAEFKRLGHFAHVLMPGGEKSILEIDRMGLSYLLSAYGSAENIPSFPFIEGFDQLRLRFLLNAIERRINTPLTSSCGRLFDAVSSLLGLCRVPSYDAQGAVLLETAAHDPEKLDGSYPYSVDDNMIVHFEPMIRKIVEDIIDGKSLEEVSRRFHATVIEACVKVCIKIKGKTGINKVALGGGCFQNKILLKHFTNRLEGEGFSVYVPILLPPNDGGIAFGQGIVALSLPGSDKKESRQIRLEIR